MNLNEKKHINLRRGGATLSAIALALLTSYPSYAEADNTLVMSGNEAENKLKKGSDNAWYFLNDQGQSYDAITYNSPMDPRYSQNFLTIGKKPNYRTDNNNYYDDDTPSPKFTENTTVKVLTKTLTTTIQAENSTLAVYGSNNQVHLGTDEQPIDRIVINGEHLLYELGHIILDGANSKISMVANEIDLNISGTDYYKDDPYNYQGALGFGPSAKSSELSIVAKKRFTLTGDNIYAGYGLVLDYDFRGINTFGSDSSTITINHNVESPGTVQLEANIWTDQEGRNKTQIDFIGNDSYLEGFVDDNLPQDTFVYKDYRPVGWGKNSLADYGTSLWFKQGAEWRMTNPSKLSRLSLESGARWKILPSSTISDDPSFPLLNAAIITNLLEGEGGIIEMNIDAGKASDHDTVNDNFLQASPNSSRLFINTHTGTHTVVLNNVNASGSTDAAEGAVLIRVGHEQGKFIVPDSEGGLYWQRYRLASRASTWGTDWYLTDILPVSPSEKPTTSLKTTLAANGINYFLWRDAGKLSERLGELRHHGERKAGGWVRIKGTKMRYDSTNFGFENKYRTYQFGYDHQLDRHDGLKRYLGVALSYSKGNSSYRQGGGNNHSYDLTLYQTDIGKDGHYLDMLLKLSKMNNDFTSFDTNGQTISGESDNYGVMASVEYGVKRYFHPTGWYLQPQGQISVGHLLGDRYTMSNDIDVDQGGVNSLIGRTGFHLGWDINPTANLYAKVNLLHEFLGGYHLTLKDQSGRSLRYHAGFRDTWLEYGIGVDVKTGERSHLYFNAERSTAGDFHTLWSVNAGFSYRF